MKKRDRKYLQELAAKLPASIHEVLVMNYVTGNALVKAGITEVKGEPVEPVLKYKSMTTEIQILDHYNELKKYFTKNNAGFLKRYLDWFAPHHQRMIKKYPEHFIKSAQVGEEVKEVKDEK